MPDSTKPATGPLILEQITQLRAEIHGMREAQDRRARQMQHLSNQIDAFLKAEIDLSGTLAQVRELLAKGRDNLAELNDTSRELRRTIEGALALELGDPGRAKRERNGN